jgi:hypothetical protein
MTTQAQTDTRAAMPKSNRLYYHWKTYKIARADRSPSAFGLTAGNGIHDGRRWSAATTRTRADKFNVVAMSVPSIDSAAPRLKQLIQPGLDALARCVAGTDDGDVWTLGRALLRECQGVR